MAEISFYKLYKLVLASKTETLSAIIVSILASVLILCMANIGSGDTGFLLIPCILSILAAIAVLPLLLTKIKNLVSGASWPHFLWLLLLISSLNLRSYARAGYQLLENPVDAIGFFILVKSMKILQIHNFYQTPGGEDSVVRTILRVKR